MNDSKLGKNQGKQVISYQDDGTFEVMSNSELMAVVGGVAIASEPTNTGCNTNCSPTNVGC